MSRYFTAPNAVVDGDTAYAEDVNSVTDQTSAAFDLVQADIDNGLGSVEQWALISQKWAEEPEDVEVEPGSYSSLHWAAKGSLSADSASSSASDTAADRVQTGLDRAATEGDRVATAADRVQTGLDRVATGDDASQTTLDKDATAADRVQTGLDRTATGDDRVATGDDKVATAADRVQTGLDRAQTTSDAALTTATYDEFDDRYLGSKSADPTLDNDGNALLTGALYWNNTSDEMRVYTGSVWFTAYLPSGTYVAGPASAVTDQIAVFDGTTGKLLKDSGSAISDFGDTSGPASATDGNLAIFDGATGKLLKDGGSVPTSPWTLIDIVNQTGTGNITTYVRTDASLYHKIRVTAVDSRGKSVGSGIISARFYDSLGAIITDAVYNTRGYTSNSVSVVANNASTVMSVTQLSNSWSMLELILSGFDVARSPTIESQFFIATGTGIHYESTSYCDTTAANSSVGFQLSGFDGSMVGSIIVEGILK